MKPSPQQVAAVIVTYHPPASLSSLVAKVQRQVASVLVIDNAPHAIPLPPGTARITNAANIGLAAALNQGCRWALEQGFAWVLLLDQDTAVFPNLLPSLADCWVSPRIALAGAGREGIHNGRGAQPAPFVITSGSLLSLQAYQDAGPFLDDLFIDWIDHEYGWRLNEKGWQVLQCLTPGMKHDWGSGESTTIVGFQLRLENYPPHRRYFIVRNWVYVCTRYFARRPLEATTRLLRLLRQMIKVLLLEPQRAAKAHAILLGLRDGISGRLGPAPL